MVSSQQSGCRFISHSNSQITESFCESLQFAADEKDSGFDSLHSILHFQSTPPLRLWNGRFAFAGGFYSKQQRTSLSETNSTATHNSSKWIWWWLQSNCVTRRTNKKANQFGSMLLGLTDTFVVLELNAQLSGSLGLISIQPNWS